MEKKPVRRSNNEEEKHAIQLAKLHCNSDKSDDQKSDGSDNEVPAEEAKAKLLWIVHTMEQNPNFKKVNIRKLMETTEWKANKVNFKPE